MITYYIRSLHSCTSRTLTFTWQPTTHQTLVFQFYARESPAGEVNSEQTGQQELAMNGRRAKVHCGTIYTRLLMMMLTPSNIIISIIIIVIIAVAGANSHFDSVGLGSRMDEVEVEECRRRIFVVWREALFQLRRQWPHLWPAHAMSHSSRNYQPHLYGATMAPSNRQITNRLQAYVYWFTQIAL